MKISDPIPALISSLVSCGAQNLGTKLGKSNFDILVILESAVDKINYKKKKKNPTKYNVKNVNLLFLTRLHTTHSTFAWQM